MENIIGKRVRITSKKNKDFYGVTGKVFQEYRDDEYQYKIELDEIIDGCQYLITKENDFEIIEEFNEDNTESNIIEHHVTISTEKLKELIKNDYNWKEYNLKAKIEIVTNLAYFKNDKELLEFLVYMEE